MKHSYKELSDLFDRHVEAYTLLAEFFGTDEEGRLNLEMFIKAQASLLAAQIGPYTPKEDGK